MAVFFKSKSTRDYLGPLAVPGDFVRKDSEESCREDLWYTKPRVDRFLREAPTPLPSTLSYSLGDSSRSEAVPPLFQAYPRDWKERQESFRNSLGLLRNRSVKVKSMPVVVLEGDMPQEWKGFLGRELSAAGGAKETEFVFDDNFFYKKNDLTPDVFLEAQALPFLDRDPKLIAPREKKILAVTLTLHVEKKGRGVRILMWDWLQGRAIVSKSYPRFPDEAGAIKNLVADLRQAVKHRRLRAKYSDASSASSSGSGELYRLTRRPGERPPWRRLARHFQLRLRAAPRAGDIDGGLARNPLYQSLDLSLSPRRMRSLRRRFLEVGGFLESVDLDISGGRKRIRLGKRSVLQGEVTEIHRDKYGNAILPRAGFETAKGRPVFLGFTVIPPFALAGGNAGADRARAVGLDLSRYGFGDDPHFLFTRPFDPVSAPTREHPYFLYSNREAPGDDAERGIFRRASRVIAQTEQAFGLKPGEVIENIFLVPSEKQNASVHPANPETIFIWDEMFPLIREGKADYVIAHEAFHSLDMTFHFSTHPALLHVYQALAGAEDTRMFERINESEFLEKSGGHSGDDVFEFFASLMNSVGAPDWQEKVEALCPRVRGLYYHALRGLHAALLSRRPGSRGTPVERLVRDRIAFLQGMVFPPYPPLANLVMLRAGEIIPRGPAGIPVLPVWEFAKTLRRSRDPVVAFLFQESDRNVVPFVQKLSRGYSGRVRFVAVSFQEVANSELMSSHFGGRLGAPELAVFQRGRLIHREGIHSFRERPQIARRLQKILRLHKN